MGQVAEACVASDEHQKRIDLLEKELQNQEKEKALLKAKLLNEKHRFEQYNTSIQPNNAYDDVTREKIEALSNEKRQVFKGLLKERKNVAKLEEEIDEYKQTLNDLEDTVSKLRHQKNRAQQKAHDAEKRRTEEEKRNMIMQQVQKQQEKEDKEKMLKEKEKNRFALPGQNILNNLPQFELPKLDINHIMSASEKKQEMPFRVKAKNNPNNLAPRPYDSDTMLSNSSDAATASEISESDDDEIVKRASTEVLDEELDPSTEASHVHSWLHAQKIQTKSQKKTLKTRLASLLTSRSEGYRQKLIIAYKEKYGKNLGKDIKNALVKGQAVEIITNLLMTSAQLDAIIISKSVANWDLLSIADIICCRTTDQLKDLHEAYKKKCKLNICDQLQALAQKEKKNTLVKVIGNILDLERKEKIKVDMNKVNEDLNFVLTTKSFAKATKERLVMLFTGSSVQFIKVVNDQFKLKSKDSLTTFIDKKIGKRSIAGHYCKVRIQYALDPPNYYAQKIKTLGSNFKKNQTEIGNIFIQRLEVDLEEIQRTWQIKNYGDGDRSLKEWVAWKTSNSKSGYFLQKMLDNSQRYKTINKGGRKSKFEQMMM